MKTKISMIILSILFSSIAFAGEESTIKALIKFKTSVDNGVSYSKSAELFSDAQTEYKLTKNPSITLSTVIVNYEVALYAYRNYMKYCKNAEYYSTIADKCDFIYNGYLDSFKDGNNHLNALINKPRKK